MREIARGSGLSAGTVSRWSRSADNRPLLETLEEGRIDLFRAVHLAVVHDDAALAELIAIAREYSPDAFYSLIQQRVAGSNTQPNSDERCLAVLAERLARIKRVRTLALEHLQRIIEIASALAERARRSDGAALHVSPIEESGSCCGSER